LSLLSKWGKCVYFENDPKLSSIVVLAPHFLSKTTLAGLFRLGVDARKIRETGYIHHSHLRVCWPDLAKRSDFETTAFLLVELLEKFDLCFVLPEDLGKPFFEQRSTFPSLLPPFPKVKIVRNESSLAAHSISEQEFEELKYQVWAKLWPVALPLHQPIQMERVFKFQVVPEELVSLVISKHHHMIEDGCVWRDYVLLVDRETKTQASLGVSFEENLFSVEIRAESFEGGVSMMSQIREAFALVTQKNPVAKWRECLRSPQEIANCTTKSIKCPHTGSTIWISLMKERAGLVAPAPLDKKSRKTAFFTSLIFDVTVNVSSFS